MTILTRPAAAPAPVAGLLNDAAPGPGGFGAAGTGVVDGSAPAGEILQFLSLAAAAGCLPFDVDLPGLSQQAALQVIGPPKQPNS